MGELHFLEILKSTYNLCYFLNFGIKRTLPYRVIFDFDQYKISNLMIVSPSLKVVSKILLQQLVAQKTALRKCFCDS